MMKRGNGKAENQWKLNNRGELDQPQLAILGHRVWGATPLHKSISRAYCTSKFHYFKCYYKNIKK